MQLIQSIADFRAARKRLSGTLGLVPTMGYLHDGHLELVRRARNECEHVAVTIFVNPAQFGPAEDLGRYPRDMRRDLELLERHGVDLVFAPPVDEMYPPGFNTWVEVQGVAEPLEGARRPGHFRGVATVVCKLFNIAAAERAYFGQKDAQQTVVVRRMARDLDIPTQVVVVPTVREADGLAMSSRNVYLDPQQRAAATVLFRALCRAEQLWAAGERDAATLRDAMQQILAAEPLADVDYVSVADAATLQEAYGAIVGPVFASMAVRFGSTRLIDNIRLDNAA